jgi:hypothetical protein
VITKKAIATPPDGFLSRWTRIEQHSSLRKFPRQQDLAVAVPAARQQCAKHSSTVRCAAKFSGNPHGSSETEGGTPGGGRRVSLYGAFFVKEFARAANLLSFRQFLCSISKPVSSSRPAVR